jgi:hypothetical protein
MTWIFILCIPFGVTLLFVIEKIAPQLLDIGGLQKNKDEDLNNYFEALDEFDKRHIIKEEEYFRDNYVR